jgi:outer membrane murein-binding lipoprotein Lpp
MTQTLTYTQIEACHDWNQLSDWKDALDEQADHLRADLEADEFSGYLTPAKRGRHHKKLKWVLMAMTLIERQSILCGEVIPAREPAQRKINQLYSELNQLRQKIRRLEREREIL